MFGRIIKFFRSRLVPLSVQAKEAGVNIGKNCICGSHFWSSEPYLISIGDDVQITTGVKIFTHGGSHVCRLYEKNFDCFGKVVIGNNVYLGTNVLIMPGVIIGDNVLVGAGSVVTKSVPSNSIVAGNPAKIIGNIEDYVLKMHEKNCACADLNSIQKRLLLCSLPPEKFIIKRFLSYSNNKNK